MYFWDLFQINVLPLQCQFKTTRSMQKLNKHIEKIKDIMSWTHLTEDKKMELIERVLRDVYILGHADGYAEGFADGW